MNERIAILAMVFLGLSLVSVTIAICLIAYDGREIPATVATFAGTAAGGLAGIAGNWDRGK